MPQTFAYPHPVNADTSAHSYGESGRLEVAINIPASPLGSSDRGLAHLPTVESSEVNTSSLPNSRPDVPTSVYLYYDARDFIIYVGVTSRGIARNREHDSSKIWWKYVARQEVEHYPTRGAALKRERTLIITLHPPFNTQHNIESASLANAYVAMADRGAFAVTAKEVMKQTNGVIPLDIFPYNERKNLLTLRTRLEHGKLGRSIVADTTGTVYADTTPRVFAHIMSISQRGQLTEIKIQGTWLGEALRARAHLSPAKKSRYRISSIDLSCWGMGVEHV